MQSGSFERHIHRQSNSHRISSIENEWNQADRVKFTYSYDTLGRISTRVMTGAIKDAYGSDTTELRDTCTYNDRHELTGAKTESKINGAYQELVGRKHAFTYDSQGNRKTHSRNGHTTAYTSNELNQYTAKTNHGYLLVEGTSSNAMVKVYATGSTEVTAVRRNDYYFRDWDPTPTSTASDYPEINIKEGSTVSATKNAWIPGVSESPTYDPNGNLSEDALWSYAYDEENRLIRMTETSSAGLAGFPDTEITFKYDYLGRRVEKKVMRGTGTETHLRFVWRGWLLVAELNASSDNSLVKTYTWGPDISGSFGGAGGNGGVLIFKDHTSTVDESFYPAYDVQGNVTGLIDTSGNLDVAYEYDSFGKLIRYAGARRASMALLYGTKYTDMESGLIYYGHRYYDPRQGRFINRDPIGEGGGINLYGFAGNNPTNRVDYLGLNWIRIPNCGSWESDSYWVEKDSTWFWQTEYWQTDCWIKVNNPVSERDPPIGGGGGSRPNTTGVSDNNNDSSDKGNDSPDKGDNPPGDEDWEPNEEDCGKLFAEWGSRYFAQPGDLFNSQEEAAIAGLFQLARRSDFGKLESGFGIYRKTYTEGGFFGLFGDKVTGFSFTEVTTGSRNSWGPTVSGYTSYNPEYVSHLRNRTLVGWGHSHPYTPEDDRFSWYIGETIYSGQVRMRGDASITHAPYAYLIGDQLLMRRIFPSNYPNTFTSRTIAESFRPSFNPIGRDVPGGPSVDVVSRLKACEKAGLNP